MYTQRKTDTPKTNISDAYALHEDRGLIYNPLFREEPIAKTEGVPMYTGTLITKAATATPYEIEFSLPTKFTAYEMVPVTYSFKKVDVFENIHILATGLEDINRKNGKEFYSNILPGKVDVQLAFLGYVTAENHLENRPIHNGKFENERVGKQYPMYDTQALRKSGVMPKSDYSWFYFSYKNTGNTILSVNGSGTFCFEPTLEKLDENGNWQKYKNQNNLFVRFTDDCYPGEEGTICVSFDHAEHIGVGKYRMVIKSLIRNETYNPENFTKTIWAGHTYQTAYQEFEVKEEFEQTEPTPMTVTYKEGVERNTWLHTYEEFMTSYDSWLNPFDIHPDREETHTMYVQCAPWTNCITVKLLTGNSMNQVAVTIPVEVETDSITVKLDTRHLNYIIDDNGHRQPAMIAQSMADMRVNVSLGPEADQLLLNELLDMKECGVNLISTTAAFETFMGDPAKEFYHCADAHWFMCDAVRQLGMKLEGWISYPFESTRNVQIAAWLTGDKEKYNPALVKTVDDPMLAEANALKAANQFKRWGDNYFTMGDGRVPVVAEDTRGWHRVDIQNRCTLSEPMLEGFRNFVKEKYGTIENTNEVWGTDYADFSDINPEEGTFKDHGWPSYTTPNAYFTEWSRPLEDLDIYRSMSRMSNYKRSIDETQDLFPSVIGLRTEGGNWTAEVPFDSGNQRYRHVYYSQRRVAAIPGVLKDSGIMAIHSDYCTLPYSPKEVADLTKKSVDMGLVPMHMIQADRMRDIAINPHYGQDYSIRYNIGDGPSRGAYISTVISLFGWFKATYENGGIPGVLWEDYLCDGYVTSTQIKEMKFFTEKLQQALNTPEGQAWSKGNTVDAKAAVANTKALNSYDKDYVAQRIAICKENRK